MPDFQDYRIQGRPNQSVTANVFRVSCQITDSRTGEVLRDFTGANAIDMALQIPGFSAADYAGLIEEIVPQILRRRAGLQER